jgi:hypothetical protein
MNPAAAHAFRSDLRLLATLISAFLLRTRVAPQLVLNAPTPTITPGWAIWLDICTEHHVDPLLAFFGICHRPNPILTSLAQRYRNGCLAKNGLPVRSRSVEHALRAIGQTMASLLGSADRRLSSRPRPLTTVLANNSPVGVAPTLPRNALPPPPSASLTTSTNSLAVLTPSPLQHAIVDMAAYVAFFYLNHPGEYAQTTSSDSLSAPFRLCDVEFSIGLRIFNASVPSVPDIRLASTFASLIFTNQKNAVRRGEDWPCPHWPFLFLPCACYHPSSLTPPPAPRPPWPLISIFLSFLPPPNPPA